MTVNNVALRSPYKELAETSLVDEKFTSGPRDEEKLHVPVLHVEVARLKRAALNLEVST